MRQLKISKSITNRESLISIFKKLDEKTLSL